MSCEQTELAELERLECITQHLSQHWSPNTNHAPEPATNCCKFQALCCKLAALGTLTGVWGDKMLTEGKSTHFQDLETAAQGKQGLWLDGPFAAVLACLKAGLYQHMHLVMDGLQTDSTYSATKCGIDHAHAESC